jgi:hypothetical protein
MEKTMTTKTLVSQLKSKPMVANKAALRQILEEQDKQTGFVLDPHATPEKARELMLAQGSRPEDNSFSCEIRRMREGE